MDYEQFKREFKEWRTNNNYTSREDCRKAFRFYRDNKAVSEPIACLDFILKQDRPASFLDGLFAKDSATFYEDEQKSKELEQEKRIEKANKIASYVYDYVKSYGYLPSFTIVGNAVGVKVCSVFSTAQEMFDYSCQIYSDLKNLLLSENDFNDEYREKTIKAIQEHKKFFITTAVSGKKICTKFFKSIQNFLDCNNAICLVLPCADMVNRKSAFKWQLPPELRTDKFFVVHDDTYLNKNLYISNIKISAKQINPQSGLPQFTQDGSVIIASTKQDLKFVANHISKMPNAIMTTGAITENDYSNDAFMSQRLSKIAEYEHILGGIVVEIQDEELFHFRQVQVGDNGEIIDLGMIYDDNNTIRFAQNTALVVGDSHFGEHDQDVLNTENEIIEQMGIHDVVLHDVFTGESISHWNRFKTVTLAQQSLEHKLSLKSEAEMVAKNINEFSKRVSGKVYVVDSNHHKFLNRYLESGRYATDPINTYYSLDIVKAMIEGKEPLEYMLRNKTSLKQDGDVEFLKDDEEKKIYGVEVSMHGDKGANGSRGNLAIYRRAYKKSVTAHTHTPEIYRGAYCVGTSSKLKLDYVKGLSSWVHSCCLIYENGTRQLINIVKDKYDQCYWHGLKDKNVVKV